ncbi:YDG domain-containing protein [Sphingobium sp. SYK-6]|uniref:YDG domain-containing protein n=1 Tax=Sphingobium sp. (strain NBRC 103272 / SYK-6) TaxID=627192 RepID=UPI0011D1FC93|nr:YDG domain-containing protein [Sphingobium sp. SYK-6]
MGGVAMMGKRQSRSSRWYREASILAAIAAAGVLVGSKTALADPRGGAVVAGQASIAGEGSGRLLVTQTTDRAIVNWDSFSIGAGESAIFRQPGARSVIANRVTGADPSQILGSIQADGQVVLINRNGILFGKTSSVDAAGLVATTHDMNDAAFMAGGSVLRFENGGRSDAEIVVEGRISVRDAGLAALVAPHVRNSGLITADLGRVAIGAAKGFSVDLFGDGLISFAPGDALSQSLTDASGNPIGALIEQQGTITASGGRVLLTTSAAREIINASVNVTGIVRADSIRSEGGTIILSGAGGVAATGLLSASSAEGRGGTIAIEGQSVTLGGAVNASGASGGAVTVRADGLLSLADTVLATGTRGDGGTIDYRAARILETATGRSDASGLIGGGAISATASGSLVTSGSYRAEGLYGVGGRIDLTASEVTLLSAGLDARGRSIGGLVRVGGAFQGGKAPDISKSYFASLLGRWGDLPALASAGNLLVGSGSTIDVSSTRGAGGTAILWSQDRTTFLGSIDARGASGGSVEISSAGDLRQAALDGVQTGAGGHLLLDPKNIVIGTVDDVESWQYAGVLGAVYSGSSNPPELADSVPAALDTFDSFGEAVALNDDGTRMAVGASGDDGAANQLTGSGAVYLFSFADGNFSNGTLSGIIGKGYSGGKNVDVALLAGSDAFGNSVALNAAGDRLAVGATGDDGLAEDASGSGAVHLFSFADTSFSGGALIGTIGRGYTGAGNINIAAEAGDGFGRSVALNGAGDLLAVGAWNDSGAGNVANKSGAVYLFTFDDTSFGGGAHSGTIGYGYAGAGDLALTLDIGDYLGVSVALNDAGDRLAVGAHGDAGFGNSAATSGAVHVIGFSDTSFGGATHLGTIGKGYVGAGDTDATVVAGGDQFGYSVALSADGTRLAVGAVTDNGSTNNMASAGAVHLFTFANGNMANGTHAGLIGKGYTGGKNIDVAEIEASDLLGFGVALNGAGDRLAVGSYGDDGGTNAASGTGAVYLMRFGDGNFSGGTVAGVIGRDAWRSDIGVETLQAGDRLGIAVALNAVGDRLAVGAMYDAGALDDTPSTGAVYLFSFTDGNFSDGTLSGIVGKGYTGGKNIDIDRLATDDFFGSSLAFNAEGTRLAVGAIGDDGSDEATSNAGAVYLLDFADRDFTGGTITGIVGKGYSGASGVNDFDVGSLEDTDRFGRAVTLNAAGDRMAVGASADDGASNGVTEAGAVHLFTLDGTVALVGTIGTGYAGANDLSIALAGNDQLGNSVSLNAAGDRLAVGALGDDGSDDLTSGAGAVYLFSFADTDFTGASHIGTIGKGYAGAGSVSLSLDANDQLGIGVSLNAAGDRLAIGVPGDAGNSNTAANAGAVYLLSFTDTDFSGGTLSARIGSGYSGGKNLSPVNLEVGDRFGFSVALNAAGDRLAAGSFLDGGASNRAASSGAIYLFGFTDRDFSGGQLAGLVGNGYQRHQDIALNPRPDAADQFGISAALNSAGDRLAVGAFGDHGVAHGTTTYGAVYLFSFSDDQFSDGALEAIVGKGYTGGKNVDLASLESGDGFGFSVALNDTGNRMAVGAHGDDGFANGATGSGAVHLFSFTDDAFSNGTHSGTIGAGYVGTGDIAVTLGVSDSFGAAVALNAAGDRLAVGAYLDDGSTNLTTNAGAVYLFRFTDTDFGGGIHAGTIGSGYAGASGLPTLEDSDFFGISVALNAAGDRLAVGASGDDGSGNAASASGAVYLFSFTDADFGGGASVARIGAGYSGGKNLNLTPLEDGDQFGRSVAFNGDGNYLVAGANLDDGFGNSVQNAGAIHLFSFTDTTFSGAAHKSTIGSGYTGTWDTNIALDVDDNFGVSAALSANGLRLAAGANADDGASNAISNSGAVYLFSTERAVDGGLIYADQPEATVNVSAASLAALLAAGTNLTLQASNDISLTAALAVDNPLGDGGDLTLQAGRSILLNATSITTDNGDLSLIGNDRLANGVVDAYRDSGNAVITMASGVSINAGSGAVSIDLRDGAGKSNSGSGDITLRAITAGSLDVINSGSAGDILLQGNITTSGAQDYLSERDLKLASSTNLTVTGAATLSIDAARQVLLLTGSKIENSFSGNLTPFDAVAISSNRRSVQAAGALAGTQLEGGAIIRTAAGGAGAIDISARGGTDDSRGINLIGGSKIEALGAGAITLHGTGGSGAGTTNYGVFLTQSSEITAANGDIDVTGEAVGTGPAPGLFVFNGSLLRTTGTGNIDLTGSASGAGAGVWISSSSASVRAASGAITITASSAPGGASDFEVVSGGLLGVAGTTDITINADTVSFAGAVSGSGVLTIQPRTSGRTIGLGAGAGDLSLSAASLANIQNGFAGILIGKADAGAMTVGTGLSAFSDNLHLLSAGALAINGALSVGSNRLTLETAGGGTQSEAITAGQLLLLGTGADYTLGYGGNAVGTLAASLGTGNVLVTSGAAANLVVGTVGTTTGVTAASLSLTSSNASADIAINNAVTTTGAQDYVSERDVQLAAGTALTVSGAAMLSIDAARQVSLGASSTIENSYASDLTPFDAISIMGNRRAIADAGSLSGVEMAAGSVVRTAAGGAGNIVLSGRGGAVSGHGIAMATTATVQSLGAGNVTLTGEAVNSTSNYSGVYLSGGSGISSNLGDIEVTALASGAAGNFPALYLLGGVGASIQSSGGGDITLQGTRQTGDGEGVWIGLTGALVQTSTGDISITGASANAVRDAVRIAGAGQVLTSAGGDITITGTAAGGGAGRDVGTLSTSLLGGAGTGDITLNADTIGLAGTTTGAGILTFQPRTGGRLIGIGATGSELVISAATLATVTNGFAEIVIGNSTAGAISVGSGLATFQDHLRLIGSGGLAVGSALNVGTNRLTLDVAGATSQSAAITAAQLLLLNATGAYTLTNAGNAIGTLAADTGTIALTHGGAGDLIVGTVGTQAGIAATSAALTTTAASATLQIEEDVTTSGAQSYTATLGDISAVSGVHLLVSGKAALTMTAGTQITLTGATIENSYAGDANSFDAIVLRANDDGTSFSAAGSNHGVLLDAGALVRTAAGGGGNVDIFGRAGEGSATAIGVQINFSVVESLGAGTLTIEGHGGAGTAGSSRHGVLIHDAPTGANGGSRIESHLGDILITGTGGAATSGASNYGVAIVHNSKILSTGTGADAARITISGTGGGTGASYDNVGVRISSAATRIESIDGDIEITGRGGVNAEGTTSGNQGILMAGGAVIQSTGLGANAAAISLDGVGGGKGASGANAGVLVTGANTAILAADGDIDLLGTGGASAEGSENHGIALSAAAYVASSGTAAVTLTGQGGGKATSASATNIGIYLSSAGTYVESERGDIALTGTGGAGADGIDASHYGIQIGSGTQVRSTGTGADAAAIHLIGTGGSGTGNKRIGVYLNAEQAVLSDAGAATIIARGGGGTEGTGNDGLYVSGTGPKIASGGGEIVVDAAKGGGTGKDFNNLTGSLAVETASGRWIFYLGDPADSSFSGLASGSLPVWGANRLTLAPASVPAGNRYVFAHQPTLSVATAFSDTKTYGDVYTFPTAVLDTHFTLSGLVAASGYGNVWLQETTVNIGLSGAPLLSSAGSVADADVAGSPYDVDLAIGTLANTAGYLFATPTSSGTLTLAAKLLSLTGVVAADRAYDGGTLADLSGGALVGVVNSDDVSFTAGTGAFADKDVGTWAVTASGYGLAGADAGNYTLAQPLVADASISAKLLSLTGVVAADRAYDGSTLADLSGGTLVGVVNSEDVSVTAGIGSFADKDVGTWAVTASGYGLAGADAGNYTLAQPVVADASISAKLLSLTGVVAADRAYDGSTLADLSGGTLVGVVNSEDVSFTAGTGSFADKDVGTWAVTASGYGLAGADAGNYTLAQPSIADASISAKLLSLTGVVAADRAYDGSTLADLSGGTLVGVVNSEDVSFTAGTGSFADKDVGTWAVTASGYGLAGADAGNYTLAQPLVADASISAKLLSLTGVVAADRAYDGGTLVDLSGGTLVGVVNSEDVNFTAGTGSFADKDVGTWAVTASGYDLAGTDAGNYTLAQPVVADASISAKLLSLTGVVAADRAYDGGTVADLSGGTLVGVVNSDDVSFTAGTGSFADKDVGTWTVTASGYGLAGADASNYTLAQPVVADATISAKLLSLTGVVAADRAYDGGTVADLSGGTLVGVVNSEDVSFTAGTGSFADKDVGTWMVTASGYGLAGVDAGNYTLAQPVVANASISAKLLSLTGVVAADRAYDGSTLADLSGGTLVGVVSSEDVSFTADTGSFADKDVGTWAVTASGYGLAGADAGNYTLAQPSIADASISAKLLSLTGVVAVDRAYDGGTLADLSGGTLVGVVNSEDVNFTAGTGSFADKDVGTWAVTASGYGLAGADAGNYTLAQPSIADASISAKLLSLTGVVAVDRAYDGGTLADLSGGTLVGVVNSEDVNFTAGTGSFADKDVGTWAVTASGYGLAGADAGNYTLAQPSIADASISAKLLSLTGVVAADRAYDGGTVADLSGGTLVGVVNSEDVNFTAGTGSFADKDVGTWAVTASGYGLAGADAGNYTLAQPVVADASISAKLLSLTGVVAADRDYDGGTVADLSGGTLVGVVNSEDVSFTAGTGSFADKDVGTWVVTASGYGLAGADAGNYTLAQPVVADATISAKLLSLTGVVAADRAYDGGTLADLSGGTLVGVVNSEDVSFTAGTGAFADKDVGTWAVTASGYGLAGTDAGNYTLAQPVVADASISAKLLSLTGVAATDRDYDGSTLADLSGGTLVGVVNSEDVSFTAGTGAFADKDVGTWAVTASGYGLAGADAGNYTLAQPVVADASISAKLLSLTGVVAADRAYDGSTLADLSGGTLVGVVNSEDVSFTAGTGAFADKDVGTWAVTASGYGLAGTDAGNYTLAQPVVADASISAKLLSLTGVAATDRDYDGSTLADLSGGTLVGVVNSEDVNFTAGTGAFADKDVGTWAVTASGYGLAGADAGNYTLAQPVVADASISAKLLSLTGVVAADRAYDGSTVADLSGGTLVGVVNSEDVSFTAGTGSFADKDVGTWAVTASGYGLAGADAGNYTLVQPSVADTTISAKLLSLTGVVAADRDYDGSTLAALSGGALVGVVGSEDVSFTAGTGSFADKDVGTWAVTASGYGLAGADAGNYTLEQPVVADASISAKLLSLTGVVAADRDYDGSTLATLSGGALVGVVGSEDVNFTAGTGAFADKDVGTWTVSASGYGLAGADAGNYTLAQPSVANLATIHRLAQVVWTGGGDGINWFDAANWSGGAVPDGANVARVVLPANVSVTFDPGQTSGGAHGGPVSIDWLDTSPDADSVPSATDTTFSMLGGSLSVAGGLTVDTLGQSGGAILGTGAITVLDSFVQSAGSISVGGNISINQGLGDLSFISISGRTLDLRAAGSVLAGALTSIGDTTVSAGAKVALGGPTIVGGTLTIHAGPGAFDGISQGLPVTVGGDLLISGNGPITLDNPANHVGGIIRCASNGGWPRIGGVCGAGGGAGASGRQADDLVSRSLSVGTAGDGVFADGGGQGAGPAFAPWGGGSGAASRGGGGSAGLMAGAQAGGLETVAASFVLEGGARLVLRNLLGAAGRGGSLYVTADLDGDDEDTPHRYRRIVPRTNPGPEVYYVGN